MTVPLLCPFSTSTNIHKSVLKKHDLLPKLENYKTFLKTQRIFNYKKLFQSLKSQKIAQNTYIYVKTDIKVYNTPIGQQFFQRVISIHNSKK